jgi:hypothetical protein
MPKSELSKTKRPRKTVDLAGRYLEIGMALRCQDENRSASRQQQKNNRRQKTSGRVKF